MDAAKLKFHTAATRYVCVTEEQEFLRAIAAGLAELCEDLEGQRVAFNFHRAKKSFARVCVAAEAEGNNSLKYLSIGLLELAKAMEACPPKQP